MYTSVADGNGGWFIGGDFTAVGGLPRSSLAHILRDGSVSAWAPSQDDHNVNSLVVSGGTLYVAGFFHSMDGQPRQDLAAFDVVSGALLPWNPDADGSLDVRPVVRALAVRGDTVFVAGDFTQVGGLPRAGLAAVSGRTGLVLGWYPGAANSEILVLALLGNSLYVGGYFTQLAGQTRNRAAAVDISTAALLPWNPNVTGPDDPYVGSPRVWALATRQSAIYLGGQFLGVGGQPRNALAAVDADTGRVLAWNPTPRHPYSYPYPYVRSLAVEVDTVFVGGNFETIGGAARVSLAAVDANTSAATGWNPRPDYDHDAVALAVSSGVVYAGGTFVTMGPWQPRGCFAAIDLTTGTLKDWDPHDNGIGATGVLVSGGKVYVTGDFTFIGGQPRIGIAALDTLTGAALPWNPGTDNWIDAMAMVGGRLYVGGQFSNVGGMPRFRAAALDTATGIATEWSANVDDDVTAIAASGGTLYLGGWFRHVGGEPRASLAAVDAATGSVQPWRADCDGIPSALIVDDSTVFVGGEYITTVNGQPRTDLAALDAATGAVKSWDAHLSGSVVNPTPAVGALALSGHTLYVGGDFYSIGGQVRPCLAAVDDSLGVASGWAPRSDFLVRSLMVSGSTLYVGGHFGAMSLLPCHGLAALSIPVDPTPPPAPFALAQNFPNPASDGTTFRFTLPAALVAKLSIYDIQGRRVATPVQREVLQAGEHDIPVPLGALRPGLYLYRLEAQGMTATRKMLIVR